MTTADLPITIDRERIARFCRERGIRTLSLFGSVLRGDFDPLCSDVDVLAEFAPGAVRGLGLRYFAFADELGSSGTGSIFARKFIRPFAITSRMQP